MPHDIIALDNPNAGRTRNMTTLFRKLAAYVRLAVNVPSPWEPAIPIGCTGGFSLHESVEARPGSSTQTEPGQFIEWSNDLYGLIRLANSRQMKRFWILTADGACNEKAVEHFSKEFYSPAQQFAEAMAAA